MPDYKKLYEQKLKSPDEVVKLVKPGMWIGISGLSCVAWLFDKALAERVSELMDIKLWTPVPLRPLKCLEEDDKGEVFSVYSDMWNEVLRRYARMKRRVYYVPVHLGELPKLFRRGILKVDIAVGTVTPMDKHGFFNFSTENTFRRAMFETAKIKIVEVNESAPWVPGGYNECIHVSEVDYIIENHEDKIPEIPLITPTKEEEKIAENIINLLPTLDGLTIQIGIGGVPDIFCNLLEERGAKNIGVHTEMLTEGIFRLAEKGIINCRKKSFLPGKIVHTFSAGSRELYDWLHYNPLVASFPSDFTNDINIISLNDNMVSINSALEVDLTGQICAESIGPQHYSGTGGQVAFVRGASYTSPQAAPPLGWPSNISIIALPSTYVDKETKELKSRIVPFLRSGSVITTPRTDVVYIVTEYGVADLRGKSVPERVMELVKIAHPDFRDWLIKEAKKLGLLI
ncbi:MAG: acetyl-CoA hydrolase/transferase C-terminal domain-containing protein [Candidatus Bathyarchaeia archaeon]